MYFYFKCGLYFNNVSIVKSLNKKKINKKKKKKKKDKKKEKGGGRGEGGGGGGGGPGAVWFLRSRVENKIYIANITF